MPTTNRFNNVIFGQKAFILKDGKILILKRKEADVFSGFWDVPGGKVESDEDLFDGISREIKEETGLTLSNIILTLSTNKFEGSMREHPIIFRNIYLCEAEGDIKLSEEHSEYLWIKPEELMNYKFADDPDLQGVLKRIPNILNSIDISINYSEIY